MKRLFTSENNYVANIDYFIQCLVIFKAVSQNQVTGERKEQMKESLKLVH